MALPRRSSDFFLAASKSSGTSRFSLSATSMGVAIFCKRCWTRGGRRRAARRSRKIVFLGDLIDRGPDSLGAIESGVPRGRDRRGGRDDRPDGKSRGDDAAGAGPGDAPVRRDGRVSDLAGERRRPGDRRICRRLNRSRRISTNFWTWQGPRCRPASNIGSRPCGRIGGRETSCSCTPASIRAFRSRSFLAAPWNVPLERLDEGRHWAWVRRPFLDHQPGPKGWSGHFVVARPHAERRAAQSVSRRSDPKVSSQSRRGLRHDRRRENGDLARRRSRGRHRARRAKFASLEPVVFPDGAISVSYPLFSATYGVDFGRFARVAHVQPPCRPARNFP